MIVTAPGVAYHINARVERYRSDKQVLDHQLENGAASDRIHAILRLRVVREVPIGIEVFGGKAILKHSSLSPVVERVAVCVRHGRDYDFPRP